MEPIHARAQLLHLLMEKDKPAIAQFIQRYRDDLPREAFDDLAAYFAGKLRRKAGRKAGVDGPDRLRLAEACGRNLAQVGNKFQTRMEARLAACKEFGLEEINGRTLASYRKAKWFRDAEACTEALCRAHAQTIQELEAAGPDISKEVFERIVSEDLRRAQEIDPEHLHRPIAAMQDGKVIFLSA